jgi:hypothetical protein
LESGFYQGKEKQNMDRYEQMGNANVENYKQNLIKEFEDMSRRGTLLTGNNITQEDLLMQIIGTIVKTK